MLLIMIHKESNKMQSRTKMKDKTKKGKILMTTNSEARTPFLKNLTKSSQYKSLLLVKNKKNAKPQSCRLPQFSPTLLTPSYVQNLKTGDNSIDTFQKLNNNREWPNRDFQKKSNHYNSNDSNNR